MKLQWLWSRYVLFHPVWLSLMMIVYIPSTVYGYYWYESQLLWTWQHHPSWLIIFVPDSPTASLWFALALLWRWISPEGPRHRALRAIRHLIEALGVITSIKYGIWATAIILAGNMQGTPLDGASWMLIIGHTAMAVMAVVYARFFKFGFLALIAAAAWTLCNDIVDYHYGVFPYLPEPLYANLPAVRTFTMLLTAASVGAAGIARFLPKEGRQTPS